MIKTVAVANQKGGVGKTTTTVNLSAALGILGKKILVIDADPQGNTTSALGIDKNSVSSSLYNILIENGKMTDSIIRTEFKNISLCPCNMDLLGAEISIDKMKNKEFILKDALKETEEQFDFVFIDCPPSLNYITINALCAANSVLIPIQCEYFALEGVTDLIDNLKYLKSTVNPTLEIEGILLTMFDARTNLSLDVSNDVKECFGDLVYSVAIPRNIRLGEAPSFGKPIFYYDKYSKGAQSYELLAKEFLKEVDKKKWH